MGKEKLSNSLNKRSYLFKLGKVLFMLYFLSKKSKIWQKFSGHRKHIYCNKKLQEIKSSIYLSSKSELPADKLVDVPFFTSHEIEALERLSYFENSAKGLMFISVPPLLALLFCPMTLFLYTPMADFFWPEPYFSKAPNINDALACFLVPAGMVYAITFGFAVQEVLQKHISLKESFSLEVKTSREIVCITNQIEDLPVEGRRKVLRILKNNIINRILQAQNRFGSVENVNVWEIADIVNQHTNNKSGSSTASALFSVLFKNIHQLFSLIPDNGPLFQHINPIQWILLQTLSGFSFLGILMIKAQSYKLEIAMCIVTVISITLLVFAVSDLDSPFNGFFRIDMSPLEDIVYELYREHQRLSSSNLSLQGHMKSESCLIAFRSTSKQSKTMFRSH